MKNKVYVKPPMNMEASDVKSKFDPLDYIASDSSIKELSGVVLTRSGAVFKKLSPHLWKPLWL